MQNQHPITIGLFAGAVLCAAFALFSGLGVFVLLPLIFGALPIYIAALGWGSLAGFTAAVASAGLISLLISPASGLITAMMISFPAAVAGHQANLAQRDEENDSVEWYPQARILLGLAIFISAGVIALGVMTEFDPVKIAPGLAEQFKPLVPTIDGKPQLSDAQFGLLVETNLRIMPFIFAAVWVGMQVANYLFGLRITRRLGVLARAEEDYARIISLPMLAIVIFVVCLLGTLMASPPITYAFAVGCGSFSMAFAVVGLGELHWRSRNWGARGALLFMTYGAIIMFSIPLLIFTIVGIFKSGRNIQTN